MVSRRALFLLILTEPSSRQGRLTKPDELVRFPDRDALAPALDDPIPLPCTQKAADCVQSRARHFGDVLTGDWKVDLDTDLLPETSLSLM